MNLSPNWPVLTQYQNEYLRRIALPIGGIGTGTVSLGGRGDLRDFELASRPAKGFLPSSGDFGLHSIPPFFAVRTQDPDGTTTVRCLEGQIPKDDYEGAFGVARIPTAGLPRFQDATFAAAYPLGQVLLNDPEVPVSARLEAFNPLVICDAENSGWPVAVLRWNFQNTSTENLKVSVSGMMVNYVGADGDDNYGSLAGNVNKWRSGPEVQGVQMYSNRQSSSPLGSMAWGVIGEDASGVTHRLDWTTNDWGTALLDFWDDFTHDGKLEARPVVNADPRASLCVDFQLAPQEVRAVTFVLAWHFPTRITWTPQTSCGNASKEDDEDDVGNYYATRFQNAWDVLEKFAPQLPGLEEKTVGFVRAFCNADLPHEVKEAALFNLSTLRTQTVFRTRDGLLFGWEGCGDSWGSCHGSCTHVWNYENALGFTFGQLSRGMREVEFLHATNDDGLMSFRTNLPLSRAREFAHAAADGQMGVLMRLYRDWKLSGDDTWLKQLWPQAKKALEFCWLPGGWDEDEDGVMEGCQHNTMDVEYFGPNPQMGFWYLGALRSCEEMARRVGEEEFAQKCQALFESGSHWLDENLFNGEYYEHLITPPRDASRILEGTLFDGKCGDPNDPDFQIGGGCLIDQLAGQYMAHACGLGYLAREENVRTALNSVWKYNRTAPFRQHFNHMRTFVLGGENGLVMCSYPRGDRPRKPFPYFPEVMTGFEYTAAAGLIQEGEQEKGLQAIRDIRARYDGKKRNPFDEAECGHHYARAMASWTAMVALTGYDYCALTQTMKFHPATETTRWFWSSGNAWGTLEQTPHTEHIAITLHVHGGELNLRNLELRRFGRLEREASFLKAGDQWCGLINNPSPNK